MPKTVLVVTSDVPFVQGGHRVIAEELLHALRAEGHRAEIVRTPSNRFGRSLEAYLANWCTDVGETGYGEPVDHVISLRWPSYAVRHPHHTSHSRPGSPARPQTGHRETPPGCKRLAPRRRRPRPTRIRGVPGGRNVVRSRRGGQLCRSGFVR